MNWGPLGALAMLVGIAHADTDRRILKTHEVAIEKELLITDLKVVESARATYPGPWSFGHLLEQAYGTERASNVIADWLVGWTRGKRGDAHRETLPPRPGLVEHLVRPWQVADGYDPASGEPWRPKLENAPFRLLAIVNRIDLAVPIEGFREGISSPSSSRSGYLGSSGSMFVDAGGGEARFVFGVTDQAGNCLEPGATLILEYGLDLLNRRDHLLEWGLAWHRLGAHPRMNDAFLDDLEAVTRAFTDERPTELGAAARGLPAGPPEEDQLVRRTAMREGLPLHARLAVGDGSQHCQLLRIRTNDAAFGGVREFREFRRERDGLQPGPLAGTPAETFFESDSAANRWLANWLESEGVRQEKVALLRDPDFGGVPSFFDLPAVVSTQRGMGPLVAMVSPVPTGDASYHWDGPEVERRLRHAFSAQTCCGCHCGDTGTEFFHIAPRVKGEEAVLSGFLRRERTRVWIDDPAGGVAEFPSWEMDTRAAALEKLLTHELSPSQAELLLVAGAGR